MPIRFLIYFGGAFNISKQELMINEEIRESKVRVVGPDGEQLGIMSSKEALNLAYDKNLDLVAIAPKAEPPVCKIMDYGKYRFDAAKREKEARKNQKTMSLKEIRISPSIDTHDFQTKVNHTVKFLQSGEKVKITVRFRGREINHSSLGAELLDRFKDSVSEYGSCDKPPQLEGKNMSIIVTPK